MTPEESDECDARQEHLHKAATALMLHFDNVQILCSRISDDGSLSHQYGRGDILSRIQQAREWVMAHDARVRKLVYDEESL